MWTHFFFSGLQSCSVWTVTHLWCSTFLGLVSVFTLIYLALRHHVLELIRLYLLEIMVLTPMQGIINEA